MQQGTVRDPEVLQRLKLAREVRGQLLRMRRRRQVRIFAPPSVRAERYVSHDEMVAFEGQVTAIMVDLASMIFLLKPHKAAAPAAVPVPGGPTIDIIDMRVRPSVRSGDVAPVFVVVRNYGTEPQDIELELTDAREKLIIGRRRLSLGPQTSRTVSFSWHTRGYKLGDHLLDVRVIPLR